jgi:hypothetical protein
MIARKYVVHTSKIVYVNINIMTPVGVTKDLAQWGHVYRNVIIVAITECRKII